MDISIIIPAFNESQKIGRDVEAAASFFGEAGLEGEVIVVDDGSVDDTAEAARQALIPPYVKRSVLRLETNSGKGAAVRRGVLESQGKVVLYADSGTCIPYANALSAIKKIMAGGLDLGLASRRLKETVIRRNQPLRRRMISRIFHLAAVMIAGLPQWISDSQCGFKVYRGEVARELYSGLMTLGFLFELEIIIKAVRRGFRIEEFPVEWTCDLDSRLHPGAQAKNVLKDLFQVRAMTKKESTQS
jgi:glycosyltransferase involved in cell wall biosynthesis